MPEPANHRRASRTPGLAQRAFRTCRVQTARRWGGQVGLGCCGRVKSVVGSLLRSGNGPDRPHGQRHSLPSAGTNNILIIKRPVQLSTDVYTQCLKWLSFSDITSFLPLSATFEIHQLSHIC